MKLFFPALIAVFCINTTTIAHAVNPILIILGTRPEAIKLIPLYETLKTQKIPVVLCSTGQHKELLSSVFEAFDVVPDYSLQIMTQNQTLFYLTEQLLHELQTVIKTVNPSMVVVQGDTTSAMVGALSAFYLKIPVAHVEAGLRTGNIYAPFPEEINRKIIASIAQYHFAPTFEAIENLLRENVSPHTMYHTGNTAIDALYLMKQRIAEGKASVSLDLQQAIQEIKKRKGTLLVLTAHRRESFPEGFMHIFNAIKKVAEEHPQFFVIYPMHPNPLIRDLIKQTSLDAISTIALTEPLSYQDMVYLLDNADIVATDSGGLQEEATTLGKELLVLRNESDRLPDTPHNAVHVVGTQETLITATLNTIMCTKKSYPMSNVYGDGTAAHTITAVLKQKLLESERDISVCV